MVSYRLIHSFIRSILIGITFIYLLITITITTTMRVCDTIIYNINNCCSAHSRINFERSIRFDSIWYDPIRSIPSLHYLQYSVAKLFGIDRSVSIRSSIFSLLSWNMPHDFVVVAVFDAISACTVCIFIQSGVYYNNFLIIIFLVVPFYVRQWITILVRYTSDRMETAILIPDFLHILSIEIPRRTVIE